MLAYTAYLSGLYCLLIVLVYFRSLKIDQTKNALDLGLVLMIFGFIGSRLFHVFYENPEHYREDWLRVFQVWSGGFVFYGGALSAFAASLILVRVRNLDWRFWGDFYAPVVALGYGLGRMSCFLAGCCYGRSCELPWAIDGRHPTQLYALAWELSVAAILFFYPALAQRTRGVLGIRGKNDSTPLGRIFFSWLALHAVGRLGMEYFRGDFRGQLWLGQSISSWISWGILMIGLAGLMINCPQSQSRSKSVSQK